MNHIIEILISIILSIYILVEIIRINILRKTKNAPIAGLISVLLLGFSIYLWIKNGLILDYSSQYEIKSTQAKLMCLIALVGAFFSFGVILMSILKMIIWKVKTYGINTKAS